MGPSPESVLEFGYAAYRSINRLVPQGSRTYRITSFERGGNFPLDTLHISSRDQWRADLFSPPGIGWTAPDQGGSQSRLFTLLPGHPGSAIEYFRLDGTRSSRLSFAAAANSVNGTWKRPPTCRPVGHPTAPGGGVGPALGLGPRLFPAAWLAPRFSLAFMPVGLDSTKFSAGFGWIPATTYFRVFTRHRDQYSIFTDFARDGITPLQPLNVRFFTLERSLLTIPRTQNLSAGCNRSCRTTPI